MRIKPLFHFALSISLLATSAAANAGGLAGAYLSANHANSKNDYAAAAEYYSKALMQDPDDAFILQNALLTHVISGDMDVSVKLAKDIAELNIGSQLSDLIIIASLSKQQDFDQALDLLEQSKDRISTLLYGLMKGWILAGSGDMTATTAHFDTMLTPSALLLFGQYHKALATAMTGDFNQANTYMKGEGRDALHLNRGSLIAHVQILSQLSKFDEAADILAQNLTSSADQQLQYLHDKMVAKEVVPFDFIRSATDGLSESFLTLANVLSGEEDERFTLIYARIAEFLRKDNIQPLLLLSEMLKGQEQYDLATQVLAKVPASHPLYLNAAIGRSDTLLDAGKPEAAIAILQRLIHSHPQVARVHMVLGDVYTSEKEFRKASKAYSVALDILEKDGKAQWFLYYARAVAFERMGDWDKAETDFRTALRLSPNQPSTLNYLGYSLVEKRIKLDEAQELIERAVQGRPNDGFITDSLGWLLYRVGKFEEAVAPMERAVELLPTDPVINDHLGDVYWKVGRQREARFQWSRAMSFEPEEKDAARIRRKLDVGLDEVLKSEEADIPNAN